MKHQIRITTISLALILFSFSSYAKLIKGVVKDNVTNNALSGVIVELKNSNITTTTDKDGKYGIEVSGENSILIFRFINYKEKEVFVGNQSKVNVRLIALTPHKALSEVRVSEQKKEQQKEDYYMYDMEVPAVQEESIMIYNKSIRTKSSKKSMSLSKVASSYGYVDGFSDYNALPPNTESYDELRDNTFVSPVKEPLSTFSIDVDAASYTNIRRMVSMGQYPLKDAVRIEEMINYFNYDYPNPKGSDPFSITLEASVAPWNAKHKLVHIGLQGKPLDYDNISQSNLVFLIDVSGSMSATNKLPLLKSSMKMLVNKLDPKDRVAIVVYAGAAGLVLPSTPVSEKATIIAALDNLKSGGSTAGGQGIRLAYKVAKENLIADGNNRIILATDGDFNVGASSNSDMVKLIEEKRDDGIFLTITGFGMGNYKDSKMEQISNAGNGNYYYIDNIKEAQKVFVDEMRATLFTIAKDVKIQVEFNPTYVKSYRLIGYVNRKLAAEDFNDDTKDAGELGAGHTVTALYEIIPVGVNSSFGGDVDALKYQVEETVVAPKGTSSNEMLTVKFRYKKPDGNTSKLIVKTLSMTQLSDKTSENFKFSAAVAEFGMLLRDSKFKSNSSYEAVIALAKSSKGIDENGYRAEFIKMVESSMLLAEK
ncbi:MAG: von Willebrand factor type A domain-containing protein [Flavobacteriales bacterium]|nr:von Willebrand factor type A domain-containing protein [Flavobacteriales bacterium]